MKKIIIPIVIASAFIIGQSAYADTQVEPETQDSLVADAFSTTNIDRIIDYRVHRVSNGGTIQGGFIFMNNGVRTTLNVNAITNQILFQVLYSAYLTGAPVSVVTDSNGWITEVSSRN